VSRGEYRYPQAVTPLDRLASALAAILEVPLVLISTFEESRQLFVGAHGLVGAARSDRSSETNMVCRQVMDCGRPSLLQDMRLRFPVAARQCWGGFEVGGYAGVPLTSSNGSCIGTLAAFDRNHRAWGARDLVVLRAFGDAATAVLEALVHPAATKQDTQPDVKSPSHLEETA
jgi:GAF domain-containing protein